MTQTVKKSIHTHTVPVEEAIQSASTALQHYQEPETLGELIPGFYLTSDMSVEDMLALNRSIESYEAADTVHFEDFETFRLELVCLGVICKRAPDVLDEKTGQLRTNRIVTLIKFRNEAQDRGPKEGVIIFESIAATEWARRMMMIFRKPGDFPNPVTYLIRHRKLELGHTFNFSQVV